ncbi:TRAP transporter small permease [Clostridiaceae bacterium 35-E11]
MDWIQTLSDQLNKIVERIVALLLTIMSVVVFSQVVFRYIFRASLPWSEELARYILVWLTFLGASIGVKRNAHIGVEVVVKFLPPLLRKTTNMIAQTLSLAFFMVLIVYGMKVVAITMMQLSPAMKINMGYVYLAIIVGAAFMTLHLIARMMADHHVTEGK